MKTLLLLPILAAAGAYVPERMTLLARVFAVLAVAAIAASFLVLHFRLIGFVPMPSEEEMANWR